MTQPAEAELIHNLRLVSRESPSEDRAHAAVFLSAKLRHPGARQQPAGNYRERAMLLVASDERARYDRALEALAA